MATSPIPAPIVRGVLAQTSEVLRRGSSARFDKIRQRTLFSSYLFAPGLGGTIAVGEYELFKTLKGSAGQGYTVALTDQETNWLSSGRVPDDQNLIVHALGVSILRAPSTPTAYASTSGLALDVPPHPADVAAIAYGMTVNLKYLTSTIPQGLVADFPSVGGVFGFHQASRQLPADMDETFATTPAVNVRGVGSASPTQPAASAHLPISRQGVPAAFERRLTIPQLLAAKDTFSMSLVVPNAITLLAQNSNTQELKDATGCLVVRVELFCTESVKNQG